MSESTAIGSRGAQLCAALSCYPNVRTRQKLRTSCAPSIRPGMSAITIGSSMGLGAGTTPSCGARVVNA